MPWVWAEGRADGGGDAGDGSGAAAGDGRGGGGCGRALGEWAGLRKADELVQLVGEMGIHFPST